MNFLAHAYLSFNDAPTLVGNMISDFVKGKDQFSYSKEIQHGIALHRFIDAYTDTHPAIKECKKIFAPYYRLYSSPIVDVVMDYFLAQHLLPSINLMDFSQHCYQQLQQHQQVFPVVFQKVFASMQQHNWLYNYQYDWGIERSLTGLQRRAQYMPSVDTAFQLFITNKQELKAQFDVFWIDMENKAHHFYKENLEQHR
jgi:acyl carrier protein phosphodiesterase